ncbi:MAG TPA: hypothetical protein VKE70_08700 [Candidatus Solibacter sp.]|nr:hypothetical protein [Candidatus Solibacter sp.]
MKRSTIAKTLAMGAVAALTLGLAPIANAAGKACSNATLLGTFADKDIGFITAPPALAGPFAGVNLETFDGHGGLTGAGIVSLNGNIIPGTFKGTYTVNPDCTGTYTVENSLGLTVHAFFVIADGGNELQIVITDPGTVITCVARRQFPMHDSE